MALRSWVIAVRSFEKPHWFRLKALNAVMRNSIPEAPRPYCVITLPTPQARQEKHVNK